MSSHTWTRVARLALLVIPVGPIVDLAGRKPGIFVTAAAFFGLILALSEP